MKELADSTFHNAQHLEEERHFLEALTRWNYFPNQKESSTELPPCFSTSRFTPEIAEKLANTSTKAERSHHWFDFVEYRATRFNNVPRVLGLLHPLAYSKVYAELKKSREEIYSLMDDSHSAISAQKHLDGRIFIMNYEDHESKTKNILDLGFGAGFRVHADITNCFGSIYTHSIEWAAQGYEAAKRDLKVKKKDRHWSHHLDEKLRRSKRNETLGLPIGPAASSIAVELILAAVDKELTGNFKFIRYVDDYTAYCKTHIEAQEFIRALTIALSKYRLALNLSKTKITELPEPITSSWVIKLRNSLPKKEGSDGILNLSSHEAISFLDYAVHLNNAEPDGSVLKFAASLICERVQDDAAITVFQYILNLSWYYPILLMLLEKIDVSSEVYSSGNVIKKLNDILAINSSLRRSDGMCWALYFLKKIDSQPTKENIKGIIETEDVVALTLLSSFDDCVDTVCRYAKDLIKQASLYDLDKNWLLLYQLFLQEKIENPYPGELTFDVLKKYDVNFLRFSDELSRAEKYCNLFNDPFIEIAEPNSIPSFDDHMEQGDD